jgi:hypothetical protein
MKYLWDVEYTDTFGGQANFCWVHRDRVAAETELGAVRKAKACMGLTGVPCRRESSGDTTALYPRGSCTVLFVTFAYRQGVASEENAL